MSLKKYLILMSFASIICWAIFVFVIFTINPQATNLIGFLLFYASLSLAVMGTSAILGFLIRFKVLKKELVFRQVTEAFRQSFLISLMIVASLMLLSQDLFTWVNLMFLIFGVFLLEYFWVSRDRAKIMKHRT
jgi:hypothetical protein